MTTEIVPDIVARIRLLSKAEGGRSVPTPAGAFGCIFEIDNDYHECRMLLDRVGHVAPGGEADDVPIKFLLPNFLEGRLHPGKKFNIREGNKKIGEGTVSRIFI
jgi:translation elongation factor EF-Tu-like GTPase